MKKEDLSQDNELLMWVKYLSQSENLSLQYFAVCLKMNIDENRARKEFLQFKEEEIPQSHWIEAIPLAYCLLNSRNPLLESTAESFFTYLHLIACEITEKINTWPNKFNLFPIEAPNDERGFHEPAF